MSELAAKSPAALPRGRHRLSPEEVLASQRKRLLEAMLTCVSERGYSATTVPQVVATARVSRNAFYQLFENKMDCLLALCLDLGEELLARMYSLEDEADWLRRLDTGTMVYLEWWRRRPAIARAYLVELPSAGPEALAARDPQLQMFEPMFAELGALARHGDRDAAPLNPLAPRILVCGITELIAVEVRHGRTEQLDGMHGELVDYIATVLAP